MGKTRSKFFAAIILASVVSCSSPHVNKPKKEGSTFPKKVGLVTEPNQAKPVLPEDQGIFDDDQFQLKTDLSRWKLIEEENGIATYEKITKGDELVAFRGEVLIQAPLKKIATVLVDQPLQKQWVDAYVEGKNISKKSEFEYVQYSQTKVPWPFENRDFVFSAYAKIDTDPNTMILVMNSVEDSAMPPKDGVVRGEILQSYYYMKEMKGLTATRLVVEMKVDPKGAIPMWLVKLSQKRWPHNTLTAIKRLALKDDLKVMPRLEMIFERKNDREGKRK
jgi:hypothetical protein